MLSGEDLRYIMDHFENDGSDLAVKVHTKLDVLIKQLDLQEEFRNRSLELQNKMDEINKNVVK